MLPNLLASNSCRYLYSFLLQECAGHIKIKIYSEFSTQQNLLHRSAVHIISLRQLEASTQHPFLELMTTKNRSEEKQDQLEEQQNMDQDFESLKGQGINIIRTI